MNDRLIWKLLFRLGVWLVEVTGPRLSADYLRQFGEVEESGGWDE